MQRLFRVSGKKSSSLRFYKKISTPPLISATSQSGSIFLKKLFCPVSTTPLEHNESDRPKGEVDMERGTREREKENEAPSLS